MGVLERMTVTVPAEMVASIKSVIDEGEYASTSEVVRDALRGWMRERDAERRELEELRAAIRAGIDSGPGIPAEEVYAELRELIDRRAAAAA